MSNTFGFLTTEISKRVTNIVNPPRSRIPFEVIEDHEIESYIGEEFEMDCEVYPNYFLIKFRHSPSTKCIVFESYELYDDNGRRYTTEINTLKLAWVIFAFKIFTFNGNDFDWPLVFMALKGYGFAALKEACNHMIDDGWRKYDIYDEYRIEAPYVNTVDLIEVCPLSATLKTYMARLHAPRLQDLPYEPNHTLTYEEAIDVRHYCGNDLFGTALIKEELREQLKMRQNLSDKFGMDLRSKSDAQIAEAVITKEVEKLLKRKVKRPTLKDDWSCQYVPPSFIRFKTPEFQKALEDIKAARFKLDGAGSPMWPKGLGSLYKNSKGELVWGIQLKLGDSVYKMGMGGLHSSEKSIAHKSCEIYILKDRDVASYYPRIILNNEYHPKQLGPEFLVVYDGRVVARLVAKANGDIVDADSGKIIINGGFGKFGSKYSNLFAPDLLLQVTLTGQLCLLMLIEELELSQISVVSANTDGIVSKVRRDETAKFEAIVNEWERITGFETEETGYAAVYSKDVNNYIAVKYGQDKETKQWTNEITGCKLKGAYGDPWSDKKAQIFRFHKNPSFLICTQAIQAFIVHGVPLAHTIRECRDIRQFISVRVVKGAAHKDGVFLGKTVRWYISNRVKGTINYISSGNKVPETEGAMPCMDLPETLPDDIDYRWYEDRCNSILVDIGYHRKEALKGQGFFF